MPQQYLKILQNKIFCLGYLAGIEVTGKQAIVILASENNINREETNQLSDCLLCDSRDKIEITMFRFFSPTTAMIAGPTGSGKTNFVFKLLENLNAMFEVPVEKVYYFYGVWQKSFDNKIIENLEFIQGVPDEAQIKQIADSKHNLIIIDDLQMSAVNSPSITNLFSRESHHRNLSVFLILQNLYHSGKYSRDITLNTHYFILFKNPRDINQIKILGNQLGMCDKVCLAYDNATAESFSYLLIDLSPTRDKTSWLRTHIFPDEYLTVYK